jgi:hypothetical protein
MTQITNYKQQIITQIITKSKNIIIYLNINYILFILIDYLIDSQLSNYYFTKFSQILYIQKLINIITIINYDSLVNYISNLDNILNQNINILLTSYDIYLNIPNLTNIIIFVVINLTFYINFCIFIYIFIKINNNSLSLFNSKLIRIFITQINFIKIIYIIFIFIFNLFSLYYQLPLVKDYFFNYLNLEANIIIAKQIFINFCNFDFTNFNLDFKNINFIFLNRVDTFQKLMNSDLDSNSKVNVSDINVSNSIESVSKVNFNNSVVVSDSDNVVLVTEEIKFKNFKDLSIEDKRTYIINQYENKGMKPTFYTINWLSDKVLSNTDGNKNNVDIFINNYLNQILNLERDTQLKSFSFHRDKPFLRHLVYKTPLEYPHVIPANKNISEFEESELKDALIKNDD